MKQMMLDLMVQMMPYMMWIVYAGAALVAIGILATLAQLVTGRGGGLARLAAWLLVLLGIFFLACQLAGMLLGAPPSINFAEFDPRRFRSQAVLAGRTRIADSRTHCAAADTAALTACGTGNPVPQGFPTRSPSA